MQVGTHPSAVSANTNPLPGLNVTAFYQHLVQVTIPCQVVVAMSNYDIQTAIRIPVSIIDAVDIAIRCRQDVGSQRRIKINSIVVVITF